MIRIPAAILLTLASMGIHAGAIESFTGQTPGGAFYRIDVPPGWSPADGLVIWNHGFDRNPIGPVETGDMGPLRDLQLAEGYAVAASSYSLIGWAVFQTVNDIRELLDVFERDVGVPDQLLMYGGSLGGLVTAQMLEEPGVNIVGALPICGALAGSRVWDGALDLRLVYDAVCNDVPGGAIPGGSTGLPEDSPLTDNELAAIVNACTGAVQPANTRSPEQQARLDTIVAVTNLPESFIASDMAFATLGLRDLIFAPEKLNGLIPTDNAGVLYNDITVDMDIERITAGNEARRALLDNFVPTGFIGDTKIISIHTDKDGLVLVENEQDYQQKVPADQFTLGIVVEDEPTHCGFTEAEAVAAWESLRGWVAGLPQPSAMDLQTTCDGLVAGQLADGPCRFDPAFMVPDLNGRVRLRSIGIVEGFEARGFDRVLD